MGNLVIDELRLKERVTGAAGAPAALKTTEPAFNHVDETLYIGVGDNGSQQSTAQKPIASAAAFAKANAAATETYVNTAVAAVTFLALAGFDVSLVAKTDGAAFSASPTMPTVAQGDNSTKGASTAYVDAAFATLSGVAPAALDTLNELAAALGDDPNFSATMTTSLAGKLVKSSNLSDLADAATAWTNIGGGTLGKQASDNVSITGGTIGSGVTLSVSQLSCGTF